VRNPIRQAATPGPPLAVAASVTWALGLVAILCDVFEYSEPLIIAARSLFASATCATICLALIPQDRTLAGADPVQTLLFARLISRWTYALLYSLALVRATLYLWTPTRSLEDFQFYIVVSVVPLWVIRAVVLARQNVAVQR
jgi:hypothetical protein